MRITALPVTLFLFACLPGCGADAGKEAPAADSKVAEKAPEPEIKATDTKPEKLHLDVTHDKSGVLARAASTLETSEQVTNSELKEHLANLSHHAEKGPSNEALCKHMTGLLGADAPPEAECVKALEHQRVHLGPEVFGEVAECVSAAKTKESLLLCEDAEKEAEKELHAKKHGEGIEPETCLKVFNHFEKLAMADAGDQAKTVEEILEEVRADVLEACNEQGTRAEVECALNAKTMQELGACESTIM